VIIVERMVVGGGIWVGMGMVTGAILKSKFYNIFDFSQQQRTIEVLNSNEESLS